jgi:hypothetical protein
MIVIGEYSNRLYLDRGFTRIYIIESLYEEQLMKEGKR